MANLLTFTPKLLTGHEGIFLLANVRIVTKSGSRLLSVTKSASRNWGVYLLADLLTVTKPAGKFVDMSPYLAGRNEGLHILSPSLPADLMTGGISAMADLLTVTKSADRNVGVSISASRYNRLSPKSDWTGLLTFTPNLLVEMGGTSASRFTDCHQICWQQMGVISARNFYCHQICQQTYWLSH